MERLHIQKNLEFSYATVDLLAIPEEINENEVTCEIKNAKCYLEVNSNYSVLKRTGRVV